MRVKLFIWLSPCERTCYLVLFLENSLENESIVLKELKVSKRVS